jgi:hypothetical protein
MQQHKDPDQKIKDTKKKNEKNRTEPFFSHKTNLYTTVYFRARSSSFNFVVDAAKRVTTTLKRMSTREKQREREREQ